jgi:hypothetical protein
VKAITDILEVSRANLYEKATGRRRLYRKADDEYYLKLIREIIEERPTYGYRRVAAILNRTLKQAGQQAVNHKRVYRIMKISSFAFAEVHGSACTGA